MPTPDRCPRRESHGANRQLECSICGWRATPTSIGTRKTFLEDQWRVLNYDGSIGAPTSEPTEQDRKGWAEEDARLAGLDPKPPPFPAVSERPPPGTRVYRVLTQRDEWFGGKFNPESLQAAINHYALRGWRVVTSATADVGAFWGSALGGPGSPRQEIVIIMEKTL